MALTRITKGVIKPNENYDTHNINSTGIVTAVGANFSGNVSVGGVLTYEDVTNVDSVGIITARQGIFIDDSITHIGDTDTKIRFPGNDQISFETGGTQRMIIGTGGAISITDIIQHTGDTNTKIRFPANDTFTVETAGAERLRITSDGRIGFNDSTPNDYELDIQKRSGVTDANIRLYNNDTTSTSDTIMRYQIGGTTANNYIYFGDSADVNAGQIRYSHSNNFLSVHTNAAERIRIDSDGFVGIGTNNPDHSLHVFKDGGDSVITIESTGDGNDSALEFFRTSSAGDSKGAGSIYVTGDTSSSVAKMKFGVAQNISHGTYPRMTIEGQYGNVGIGSEIPQAKFVVSNDGVNGFEFNPNFNSNNSIVASYNRNSGAYSQLTLSASQHIFSQGGTEYARFNASGNLGIGTNNPQSLLSLYSDAAGEELLHFDMGDATDRRGWKFKQGDTGTSTELILQADANGKVFQIESASGAEMFYAYTASSGGYIRINPELHISDYIKHIGDHDTNIRFPADNTFSVETAGSERLRITSGGDLIHTSTDKTLSLVTTRNVNSAGTKIAFFGANRYDTDEEFAAIKGHLVSNSGGSGNKQNGSLQFIVGSASHTHAMTQGGYVGIATGNPQALLHLQGTGGNTQGLYFKNGPHDVVRQYFANGNDNSDFVITYDGTGGAEITLKQAGNVVLNESNGGKTVIGYTPITPTNPLTIAGASASAILEIQRTSANSTGAIGALNFTAVDGHSVANIYALGDGDNEGAHLVFKTTSAAAENSPYASGTTERVRISSAGNVGIGSDIPQSLLDVRGDINFQNYALISNFDSNGVGGTNIDHIWHSDASNYGRGGTWNFVSDTSYKATGNSAIQIGYLSCSGGAHFAANNVAIGLTTVSRGPLHVHENSGDDCEIHLTNNETGTTSQDGLTIFTDTDTSGVWSREDVPFDIATAGTRSIRLHNTGGLSINTTSKSTSALLHVDNHSDRNTGSDISNASQYVIVNDCHFGGSGGSLSANRTKAGIRNDIEFTSTTPSNTSSGNRFSVFGIHNDVHATKFAYVTDGIYSFVKQTADNQPSTSNSATIRGVYGYAQGYCTNTQGNVNVYGGYFLGYRGGDVNAGHVYGVYARAHNTNGTNNTGDLTGVYSEWEQDEGTTIANAYCFRGYGDRDAGTITNGYILNGSFGGDGSITNRWGVYIGDSAKNRLGGELTVTGDLVVNGSSKQFRIPHPIVGLSTTKDLVHAAIEGPQIDLIYRGKVDLVNGTATVNLDTKSRMTEGTFVLLNRDVQCFTTNETGWTNVKGSVTGNQLTIIAQENTCTDTISWMVIGERQDDAVKQSTSTNDNGKLIMEPLKEILPDADFEQPECEKNIYNEE